MRVIAGEFRSRRLKSLPGDGTRPTPDRLRESLFNILAPRLPDAVFIDAYAGTGAVGIEALSRGARRCVLIEQSKAAVAVIRENLKTLGITSRVDVVHGRVLQHLKHREADIVFLDPPYSLQQEYLEALSILSTSPLSLVIAQHEVRFALPGEVGPWKRTRLVRQGDNALSFFQADGEAPTLPS